MKTIIQYINESLEELYHYTNIHNLSNICMEDCIFGSPDDGHNEESIIKHCPFFISLTRTRRGDMGYPAGLIDQQITRIVFDVDKIKSKFKIRPVDYMHGKALSIRSNWKNKEAFDKHSIRDIQINVENEERLYMKDDQLKDLHKYIKEIHVCTDDLSNRDRIAFDNYYKIYNIPIKFLSKKEFVNPK